MTTGLTAGQVQEIREAPKGTIGAVAARMGISVKRAYSIRYDDKPASVQHVPIVYRAFNAGGVLLYVGATKDFETRKRQHQFSAKPGTRGRKPADRWWDEVDRWEAQEYRTLKDALTAEAEAIRTECPKYNGSIDAGEPFMGERYEDIDSYMVFVRQAMRGAAVRVGASDCEALTHMAALRDELEDCITVAVAALRNNPDLPASWADIGNALGMRREHAHRKYRKVGGLRQAVGQPGHWR